MIGRRAVVGLSLLSALVFCAFAAQSASAIVTTTSKTTTAFTCVKDVEKKGDFKDAHCDVTGKKGEEEFKHVAISGKTDKVEGDNCKVTNETKDCEPGFLKSVVNLVKTEVECSSFKNVAANSFLENSEPEPGKHTLSGTAETEFTGCVVKNPLKCEVKEPIVSKATVHGVEGMEGPKGEKNAMGLEFVGEGVEETFATLEFKNKGAEACGLNGVAAKVKGRVVATNGPTTESAQENKESGATLVFTPKFKMQTLKVGKEPAEFSTIATVKMEGGNPISATTTP
jgi:hypothetical protein